MNKDNIIPSRITYNNYTVLNVRIINKVMLIKTCDVTSGEIFWFVGIEMSFDLYANIKRILAEDVKYPNKHFRETFKNDYVPSPLKQQKANERKVV